MKTRNRHILLILIIVSSFQVMAQISPGKLSNAHANLEGISNCTECHVIGEKETSSKCLECHKEINNLQAQNKGYHSSEEVRGKKCATCHGEHYGREFQLVKFDQKAFDHSLSGYDLLGKHKKLECAECHKEAFIKVKVSQKKENTFLGFETACLSCHEDFHQNTLSSNCTSCHNQEAFRPAVNFNHSKTKYPLEGKHAVVDCAKCHKIEIRNAKNFQQFAGVEYKNCTSCHIDVHENRFGNDCRKCHDLQSFKQVKSLTAFNHEQTKYPLRGAHLKVDCKKCHLSSYTTPVKYAKCIDCHKDYHDGQFKKKEAIQDCSDCHTNLKFTPTTYTLERHNKSQFGLEGAHMAVPCFECHKKSEKWDFRKIGKQCVDCHENIHKNYLDQKYIPNSDCKSCHSSSSWNEISFDHHKTDFVLKGKHVNVDCRACHFKSVEGIVKQQFSWPTDACTNCHDDIHYHQFEIEGITSCIRCHTSDDWKPTLFNHDQARFKLDGKHRDLNCILCHKINTESKNNFRVYKFKDISCASCH